jgi:CBS-domain-containing membrane protein
MSVTASPRNVLLSHTLAVACGLFALWLVGWIYPGAGLSDPFVLNWYRILVIALTMGATGVIMVGVKCIHPPAAASALIAAMGFLNTTEQVLGVIGAMLLLALEAIVFNRFIGGLPYPLWRADPKVARNFGAMAGIPDSETTFWRQLAAKTFQQRGS